MNQGYSAYAKIGVNTATPLKLILMLYDGAIQFLNRAIEDADRGDIKNKNINANNARDIVLELNNSLNMEVGGEVAVSLRGIYFFMNRHILQTSWNNDTKGFREVIELLSNLREAWQHVYDHKGTQEDSPRFAVAATG